MKIIPSVPGSFTRAEWIAFGLWSALGVLCWSGRRAGGGAVKTS